MAETQFSRYQQFPLKKAIVILSIILVIILFVFLILSRRNSDNQDQIINAPTGIIIPTNSISQNELDITNIEPPDQSQNIALGRDIIITFSRNFTMDEIEFFLSPTTNFSSRIDGNKLIVSPNPNWQPGTLYTYSVNFRDDNQKVRLYRFQTTGPTQQFLPDTQPSGLYEKELQEQLEKDPAVFLTNHTPYENDSFAVTSHYEQQPSGHFAFTVQLKKEVTNQSRVDFNNWALSLGLTQEQINSLDITYEE